MLHIFYDTELINSDVFGLLYHLGAGDESDTVTQVD